MLETVRAPLKAAGITAFTMGVLALLINPPSLSGFWTLMAYIAGGLGLIVLTAWATVALTGEDGPSESEVEAMIQRSERLATMPPPERVPDEFDELVIDAIDDLPGEFRELLETTPVLISQHGHEYHAYGHYMGDTISGGRHHTKIVIYRDTLERDFGEHPELLRAQVQRTLRHEVAHHLGWGERGVRELGL